MGTITDHRGRVCCDACGNAGGVRKRTCPYFVILAADRSISRTNIRWCSPPKLCSGCYTKAGGNKKLHTPCAEASRRDQVLEDAKHERLAAGDYYVTSAEGDWHEEVPAGMTRVTFWRFGPRNAYKLLVPADFYDPGRRPWRSDYDAAFAKTLTLPTAVAPTGQLALTS